MTVRDYIEQAPLIGGITDECQAIAMLNAARKLLWPLDDFEGTIAYGCLKVHSCGGVYPPAQIETIRNTWQCNKSVPTNNENWMHVDANVLADFCGEPVSLVRTDRYAVIPRFPPNAQIGFAPRDVEDIGKFITITTRNAFGTVVSERIELTSIDGPTYAELSVAEIISINKPPTIGAVSVWSRLPSREKCEHTLEAFETDVRYYQYIPVGLCSCQSFVVKGKKKFVPFREGDYEHDIGIRPDSALQFASQAIEHQRSGNYKGFQDALTIARKLAERTKEDLRRTASPGSPAWADVALPIYNRYGYG